MNTTKLKALRTAIPFLNDLPDALYFNLDPLEFYLPSGDVAKKRASLEKILNSFIMTYRRDRFNLDVSVDKHLCANIQGAELNEDQLSLLFDQEKKVKKFGVSFVAYQKPLRFITPHSSNLAKLYWQMELL